MPTFNSVIGRDDAEALIPEDVSSEILKSMSEGSNVTQLARRLPNMTRAQRRLPILTVLPSVSFTGEAGRTGQTFGEIKQTTEAAWSNKYINAEEMAVIVVVPENTLEDMDYNVWDEIKPEIIAALGYKIDYSMLFGVLGIDVPSTWPNGIVNQMPSSHRIADTFGNDLYDAIMGEGGVISKVEEDGYFVNGHIAKLALRAKLRGLRVDSGGGAGTGTPLFTQDMKLAIPYALDGQPLLFPTNGSMQQLASLLISGDWNQVVWSMRKDVSIKVLTEGVITNDASPREILHNLGQDDMVGLRVTFRMGWQIANPINRVNGDDATRYPFASLTPTGS